MIEKRVVDPSSDEAFELMIESQLKYKFLFFKNCTRDTLKTPKNEKEILEAILKFCLKDEDLDNKEYFKNVLIYSENYDITSNKGNKNFTKGDAIEYLKRLKSGEIEPKHFKTVN